MPSFAASSPPYTLSPKPSQARPTTTSTTSSPLKVTSQVICPSPSHQLTAPSPPIAGGPPNGLPPTFTPTTPPHETHFAIQLLSRFGLAYLLASSGTLKDTWLSICAPGGPKSAAPDLDDLELTKVNGEGTWRVPRLLRSAGRDTAVMDGITSVSLSAG